ncbi:MAG: membrane-bound O-acyltransferase family protein [Planctomycetaceae bacterium]|nr:membrane-bound O-acyltransferase family protein [Planctomycetaceae bacterium]
MLFNSYQFLFAFLPVTAVVYFLLGRYEARRAAAGWLVLCSLFFYAYWNPAYLLLLGGSVVGNYLVGRALGPGNAVRLRRQLVLSLGVLGNLALLGYYKYANFFVDSAGSLLGTSLTLETIILPLAISFFTFQQIAYLADQFREAGEPCSFLEYCLFVTFFPQLIAGPIVHHRSVRPQFADPATYRPQAENLAVGMTIFLIGLFKKVVLADQAALFANHVFDGTAIAGTPTLAEAWLGTLAYTFQLYFDFSGYSDMAIGLGRLFGIRLPVNFNSPYKATSIVEFWRRWHITLSVFLRDYLYVPLGGNRRGKVRRYGNLMLTMLLGGLWHGAGWNYVVWGGLHGAYLCVNHAWSALCRQMGWIRGKDALGWKLAGGCLTFLAVIVGWVFFRSADFNSAGTVLQSMVGVHGWDVATGFNRSEALGTLAALGLIIWGMPNTMQLMAAYRPVHDWDRVRDELAPVPTLLKWMLWRPSRARAVLMLGCALLTLMNMTRVQEFLYFQF